MNSSPGRTEAANSVDLVEQAAVRPSENTVPATRRRLRICHLAYTFYENDNRVMRYAEARAKLGDQVEVLALRRPGQSLSGESNGVRIFRIQRRAVTEKGAHAYLLKIFWFFIKSTVLLAFLQVRGRYDIVHVHNVPDFLVFAAIVPRLFGARIILDIHDIVPELYAGKFGSGQDSVTFRGLLQVERVCCRFAAHVIVANHLWHDKLVRRAVVSERCTAILNYPDLRLFKPRSTCGPRNGGKFLILYPGTLNHHQGLDVAIKAFGLIKDRMPDAEFHIYGEGSARAALVSLVNDCRLLDRVKLLERLPLDEISEVMASADVGVVPKRADGFGDEAFSTKTLEFMACGVPVIVSRTKVDAHYFDDTLVRFFTPGDSADLARVILDVYEHRSEHDAWIRTARDFAVRNSWQMRAVDYFGIVEALVAPSRSREAVAG